MIYSEGLCGICQLQAISFLCVHDSEYFCEQCVSMHVDRDKFSDHKIVALAAVQELEQEKKIKKKALKNEATQALKANLESQEYHIRSLASQMIDIVLSRKENLINLIKISSEQAIKEINERQDEIINSIKKMIQSLNSKNKIIENITEINQASSMEFVETFIPNSQASIPELIKKEFSVGFNFYPEGKPKYLYYFIPGSADLYKFNIITKVKSQNPIGVKFKDFTSVCYGPDDMILCTGGWEKAPSSKCYLINTKTFELQAVPDMLFPRYQHSSICVNSIYYVFGGITSKPDKEQNLKDKRTRRCEKWNGENWEYLEHKPSGPIFMNGICEHNDNIYLTGRNHIEVFNTDTLTFSKIELGWEKRFLNFAVTHNNKIIIFRGNVIGELDKNTYFVTSPVTEMEWWSSYPAVSCNNEIYVYINSKKSVYSFDYTYKELYAWPL
jgi:hypothetical protein